MTSEDRSFYSTIRILAGRILAGLAAMLAATPAMAQEDATSPPAALEFPFEATPESPRGLSIAFFGAEIESAADLVLCRALMDYDGKPLPAGEFEDQHCLPEYRQKVKANEGIIHWASGARPIGCSDCIGRPFMSAQDFLNRPNLRRAMLFGRLKFTIEATGPNRDVVYPFDAFFTCNAQNGARTGNLVVDVKFGEPVLGDPSFIESALSFFSAGRFSDYLEMRIKERLTPAGSSQSDQGPCRSVGKDTAGEPKSDQVKFDLPGPTVKAPKAAAAATAAIRDTATIRFTRIVRNPLPTTIAPEHAHPGDVAARQFSVFVNGQQHFMPPGGLDLPPEGESATINFCKTVDLTGANQLQILFVNDLGGAVWSQFSRGADFGAGGARKMTTARTIILPGRQGPNGFIKPSPFPLREFELSYDITFSASPESVGMSAGATTAGAGSAGAATGGAGATAGNSPKSGKAPKTMRFNKNAIVGRKPRAEAQPQEPCVQL